MIAIAAALHDAVDRLAVTCGAQVAEIVCCEEVGHPGAAIATVDVKDRGTFAYLRIHPCDLAALLLEARSDLGAPRAAVPNLLRVWGIPVRCDFLPYPLAEPRPAMPLLWEGDSA